MMNLKQRPALTRIGQAIAVALCSPMVLGQDSIILEEVMVTAQRREQSQQEVPISVAILAGEEFRSMFSGGEDILALGTRVPGLYAESSNGRVAPRFYLRGLGNIDFDLGASQPVSVIMDEVVMENTVLKSFPLFDMQNVEVIRGPQGTLFGRNTTAGIVKFNSNRPSHETEGFVSASWGRYNTVNVEGAVGGSLSKDVLAGRVSFVHRHRDDWIDNGFTGEDEAMGEYDEFAGRAQLLWTPSDRFSALGLIQARDLEGTSSIFRANVFDTGSNSLNRNFDRETVYYDGGDGNPQEYDGLGATLKLDWSIEGMTITSISSYQDADGFSRGDIDGGVVDGTQSVPVPPGITYDPAAVSFIFPNPTNLTFPGSIFVDSVTQDGADTDQFTQEIRLASDTDGRMNWQVGAFYFDSELVVTTESFASFGFVSRQDTQVQYENTAWALFGQLSYDVNEQLTLTGGVRYTDDEKDYEVKQFGQLWLDLGIPTFIAAPINESDGQWSGEFSANYALNDKSSIYGRISTGFRAQTIQGRDVAFLEGPSSADSETILTFEAGYKADLMNDRLRLNIAAFVYEVDDMQLSIIGGASNTNQVINADTGEAYGFEIDGLFIASENLTFTFGASYTDTEISDNRLSAVPCAINNANSSGANGGFGSGCTPTDPSDPNDPSRVLLDGNPFPRAPETTYNATMAYTYPLAGNAELFLFSDWAYQGELNMPLYESKEHHNDGQWELGLRAGYRNLGKDFEIAAFGRNITDEENIKGFVDFSNNTGFVNEPRIYGVEARYNF